MAPNRGEDDIERLPRTTNEYPSSSMIEHARRPSEAYVNLHANIEAKIKNPLWGLPRARLLADVDDFCRKKQLEHYRPLIRKGALVAQDPTGYEDIDGDEKLNDTEIQALRDEILHKWRVPFVLYLTVATCSIGAAVQGWDQTGSNGANLEFPYAFNIGSESIHDKLLVGLVNSAPYIGTALFGCWLSDPLNSRWGRRGTIFFSANFCLWPVIGSAFCNNWRQLFACRVLLGIGMGTKASTESPRWYMKKNRYQDAMKSLLRLRNHPIQAARDLYYIHAQLEVELEFIGEAHYARRFVELFTIPRVRRATVASFVVMIAQQMCGINIIAFYSTSVFRDAGANDNQALLASMGFGLVNFVFAWPAIWTIDTFGRRSLLLFTFPQMAWTLLAAGLCTLIPGTGGAHMALVALFVYLFAAFYSPGEGPVPFTYSAEVFPLSHREVGMSWAVATCLFWAAVLSITFPLMLARLHAIGAFGMYAGFNIVALVMIFLLLPETKQRTLEELDYIFAVPTRVFMRYQVTKVLPWWIKRWIFFQREARLEPLYQFDTVGEPEDSHSSDFGYENDKAKVELKDTIGLTSGVQTTH
ncbi:sorbitol transporter [Fusarium beomiforme]|uniref:Sorbitol transporter n=1 Tax=Fusarium beomiforme TaxID=44412 RepID=A0A9P5AA15_9HYPO|nr:sorbitol transporter [Fusarium beomiforme]